MAVLHPRARFDSYVEGALPPASRERISAHLDQCEECRREVDQRERILQAASSLDRVPYPSSVSASSPSPSRAWPPPPYAGPGHRHPADAGPHSAALPVLEAREGVAGWKVVVGLGAIGLVAVGVLSTAWIAGDPEAVAGPETGENHLLPPALMSSAPAGPDGGSATDAAAPPAAGDPPTGISGGTDPHPTYPEDAATDPAVLSPAGVGGFSVGSAFPLPEDSGKDSDGTVSARVDLAGAVELTPDMVADLRQLGWNVPALDGLGLNHQSTGWNLGEDTAEVVMSLQNDGASLVLHECRSLAEDAEVPGCPLGETGAGTGADAVAEAGDTRDLSVGVEMSVLEHGDGTWTATARTANAAYTVDSDLPADSADRVMALVVISERSRVQSGTAPEGPADRLTRGFERILPWMGESGEERR